MVKKKDEKELLYEKGKASIQEIAGWKVFIFLPLNIFWRLFVVITVIVEFVMVETRCMYNKVPTFFDSVDLICNLVYILDVTLATMHFGMRKTRKLKYGSRRHLMFLLIDYLSLLPLERIFNYYLYNNVQYDERVPYYLGLVKVLRIYQFPVSFRDIKVSMYNLKFFVTLQAVELILYYLIFTHFLSCFIFLHFNEKEKKECLEEFFDCVFENEMMTFFLLQQAYVRPHMDYPLDDYKLFVIIVNFIGYIFTCAYVIPCFIFGGLKILSHRVDYSKKRSLFKIMTKNLITDKVLEKKVLDYFHMASKFGTSKHQDEVLRVFPLGMKKNICCDMHWEAFRHSILMQDLTMGCKRSLSLCMTTEFVTPKTILFEKDRDCTYFLYLESGLLHVMAAENDLAPVMSFSGGTVLGEISFFLQKKPTATVRTEKFSVVHVLKFRDFFKVIADYPNDKLKVVQKLRARLTFVKSVHKIKSDVCSLIDLRNTNTLEETKLGNIKWIKKQCRAVSNLKNAEVLMNLNRGNQNFIDDYQRQVHSLGTQIDHTSVFLRLISFNDQAAQRQGVVCVKSSFPWLMNPQSYFFVVWRVIIFIAMVFTVCLYPAFIGWSPHIPNWFYSTSIVISFIFIIDVLLQFSTAVRSKNSLVEKFFLVFTQRIATVNIYFDIVAAIPFQVFAYNTEVRFASNLYFSNALVKSYILIVVLQKWTYSAEKRVFTHILAKYILLLLLIIYLFAAAYNLTGIECIFFYCDEGDWYINLVIATNGTIDPIRASLLKAVLLAFDIPEPSNSAEVFPSVITFWVLFVLVHFFRLIMKGECTASYILNLTQDLEYKVLIDYMYNFTRKHKLGRMIRKRVISTMQFNWNFGRGNRVVGNEQMWDLSSWALMREMNRHVKLPFLAKSKLFQLEEEKFLMDMCARASRLVLPAKSVLLTLGTQTRCLYIVQKGFVQVNSFVSGDLHLNTAKPMTARQGDIFPVIDALSQTPAAVSAVTASDCELLLLDLEDVLSVMMIHGMFKDVVESVQETDISLLTSAKLAMSEYKDAFGFDEMSRKRIFSQIKCLGGFLNFLLKKRAIDSRSSTYVRWESYRVLHIMISLVLWPVVYSCCPKQESQGLYLWCLAVFDLLHFPDFYFRLHVAFYNKIGIYVTHTLFTALHYLSTSFAVDLIAFAPNFHVIFILRRNGHINFPVLVIHMVMRSLSLYRFIGFLSYWNIKRRTDYQGQLIIALTLFSLAVHYYTCCMVYLQVSDAHEEVFRLTVEKVVITEAYEYYFTELGLLITMLLRGHCYLNDYGFYSIVLYVSVSTFGLVAVIILYSHLTLKSTSTNFSLTKYQHYMQSFVKYLCLQKVEGNIKNQAVEHFEYEWSQQRGRNTLKIFSKFPQSLHEDIMFPLYKNTLSGVDSLSKANEYFYRTLSRNAEEIFLKEDSVVIFQKEVQANIYFIHKGQCLVENSTVTLYKGAIIGDIKRNGLMKNTITAKTNLELLKVPSSLFFLTLNNFYTTKVAFMAETAEADDFVKSIYTEPEDTNPKTLIVEEVYVESEFVSEVKEQIVEKVLKKKTKNWYLNMESKKAKFLRFFFMLIAFASLLIIPIFMAIRLVTSSMRAVIYGLDVLWIIQIILSSRIISYKKHKKQKRWKSVTSIVLQVISVLPIELVPLAHYGLPITDKCCYIMSFCYVNRLCRVFFIYSYFKKKGKQLLMNFKMTVLEIFIFKIMLINVCSCINIGLNCSDLFQPFKCYQSLTPTQLNTLFWSYLCVLNTFFNGSFFFCLSTDFTETAFHLLIASYALISKAFLINNVLMVKYVSYYNKSIQMVNLQKLQNYLTARDVSPVLLQRTERYFSYLLSSYYEGTEPVFLKNAPSHLKVTIMQDIYMSNLEGCYYFQNVDEGFLKQLATRLFLNVFFPGDYIAEKGDVDHNMYFIKEGEVYCIETDENYTALETATSLFVAGNYFGGLQGILSCYPHSQTYRAKTLTNILVLNFNRWEDLRAAFPEVSDQIFRKCLDSLNA